MLRIEGDRTVTGLAFSPCGQLLAVAGWEGVSVWPLTGGSAAERPGPSNQYTRSVAFSPCGRRLAWVENNAAVACAVSAGQPAGPTEPLAEGVAACAFLPSGRWVAAGSGHLLLDGRPIVDRFANAPLAVAAGRERLAVGRRGGRTTAAVYAGPSARVADLAGPAWALDLWSFTPAGELVSTASDEPASPVVALALAPDGDTLVAVGTRGMVAWDIPSAAVAYEFTGPRLVTAAFTPDGRRLLAGGQHPAVLVWDVGSWGRPTALDWGGGWVDALAVAPDGLTAAASFWDGDVVVWDT